MRRGARGSMRQQMHTPSASPRMMLASVSTLMCCETVGRASGSHDVAASPGRSSYRVEGL